MNLASAPHPIAALELEATVLPFAEYASGPGVGTKNHFLPCQYLEGRDCVLFEYLWYLELTTSDILVYRKWCFLNTRLN